MVWVFFLFYFVVISSGVKFHFTLPFFPFSCPMYFSSISESLPVYLSLFSPHCWLVNLCLTCPPVPCSCCLSFDPPQFAFTDFTQGSFFSLYFGFHIFVFRRSSFIKAHCCLQLPASGSALGYPFCNYQFWSVRPHCITPEGGFVCSWQQIILMISMLMQNIQKHIVCRSCTFCKESECIIFMIMCPELILHHFHYLEVRVSANSWH